MTVRYPTLAASVPRELLSILVDPGLAGVSTYPPARVGARVDAVLTQTPIGVNAARGFNLLLVKEGTIGGPIDVDLRSIVDPWGGGGTQVRLRGLVLFNWSTTDGQTLLWKPKATGGLLSPFAGVASGARPVPAGALDGGRIVPGVDLLLAPCAAGLATPAGAAAVTLDPQSATITYSLHAIGVDA